MLYALLTTATPLVDVSPLLGTAKLRGIDTRVSQHRISRTRLSLRRSLDVPRRAHPLMKANVLRSRCKRRQPDNDDNDDDDDNDLTRLS